MTKELKAFVRLDRYSKRYKGRKEDLETIFQGLKALEIIKNKCSPLLKQYLLDLLPKEESDLLRKVLNNEKEN